MIDSESELTRRRHARPATVDLESSSSQFKTDSSSPTKSLSHRIPLLIKAVVYFNCVRWRRFKKMHIIVLCGICSLLALLIVLLFPHWLHCLLSLLNLWMEDLAWIFRTSHIRTPSSDYLKKFSDGRKMEILSIADISPQNRSLYNEVFASKMFFPCLEGASWVETVSIPPTESAGILAIHFSIDPMMIQLLVVEIGDSDKVLQHTISSQMIYEKWKPNNNTFVIETFVPENTQFFRFSLHSCNLSSKLQGELQQNRALIYAELFQLAENHEEIDLACKIISNPIIFGGKLPFSAFFSIYIYFQSHLFRKEI